MKSNRKKYYTTVGLIWVACVILLFFVYMLVLGPQRQQKKNMADQLIEAKLAYDVAVKAGEEQTQARLSRQLADLQARLKGFAVDSSESANLTFDIGELASEQQIDAFDIESQDDRNTSYMSEFTHVGENYFDVSFIAGFNQFAGFLSALERHEPTMLVDSFAITRSEDFEQGHRAKLNLAALVKKKH